jgi:hypothetical protein
VSKRQCWAKLGEVRRPRQLRTTIQFFSRRSLADKRCRSATGAARDFAGLRAACCTSNCVSRPGDSPYVEPWSDTSR